MNHVDDLIAMFRACRVPQDFYRIYMSIDVLGTPDLIGDLAARKGELPYMAWSYVSQRCGLMGGDVQRFQRFTPEKVNESAYLFRSAASTPAKCLIVGFSGSAKLLLTSLPTLLQSLPGGRCDLLLLWDASDRGFMFGLRDDEGFGSSLSAMADIFSRYDEVISLGTSAGGAAGLLAGRQIGATRAFSIGGFMPGRSRKASRQSKDIEDRFLANLQETSGKPPVASFIVHSTGADHDPEGAEELSRFFDARGVAVSSKAHAVFQAAMRINRLPWLLDLLLFGDPPDVINLQG